MRSILLGLVIVLMSLDVAAPTEALAQSGLTKQQVAAARRHYTEGQAALKGGRYEIAVQSFIDAYEVTRDPKLFFHVARAYELDEKKAEALVFYRRYMNEAELSASGRREVETKIESLTRETDAQATRDSAPPRATPKPAPRPEPAPEPAPGEEPETVVDEPVAPTATGPRQIEDTGERVLDEPAPFAQPDRSNWQSTAGWVSIGVAGLAGATGAFFAAAAESREDDLERLTRQRGADGRPPAYQGSPRADYDELRDEGERFETLSWVAFGTAGALVGVAVVLFLTEPDQEPNPVPSTRALGARLSPQVAPGSTSVTATWSF